MDALLPTTHVEDEDIDRETLATRLGDRRWRSWTCPGCGCTQAGYHLPHDLALCAGCVQRRREGKALLSAREIWQEVLVFPEVKAAGPSSRPGRARLTRDELAAVRDLRQDVGKLYEAALDADAVHVMTPDGDVVPAACAVCQGPVLARDGGRAGNAFYCGAHAWGRTA